MEQKPRWNWVITLAAAFLAFCLGFGVARWTQHTDGVTVRTARTIPAQTESALPSVPAAIRRDTTRFPQGTNVNFVQITGDGTIRMRTYERGVENETLACGTGATAAAIVTAFARQPHTTDFRITVPGGALAVRFSHEQGTQTYTDIRLTGPARRVFEGVFDSENF